VCGLVRDNVVRQASEDQATALRLGEIPEHQRLVVRRVKRVGVGEGVRSYLDLVPVETPGHAPAQREFETRQRAHDDRIRVHGVEIGAGQQLLVGHRGEGVVRQAVEQFGGSSTVLYRTWVEES